MQPRYWSIPSVFAYSMTITLGCRLVLNLCDAFHHPRGMWNTPSETVTAGRSCDSEEVGRVSLQFARGVASQGLEYELDVLKESSSRETSLEGLDSIQSVA